MKSSVFITLTILTFYCQLSLAQSFPAKFNYQVSIRDSARNPISDRSVCFRISILENPNDKSFYSYREVHNGVMTNFGTASLVIGNGVAKDGTPIDLLPFQSKTYHLRVELDEDRDGDFDELITTQLISVPYALVASQISQNNATDGQVLKWNENLKKWIPGTVSNSGGGPISLNGDVTGSSTSNKVERIQNRNVAFTAPKNGQVLKWNESIGQWAPGNDDPGSGQGGPPTGSAGGDLTGDYPSPFIKDGVVTSSKIVDDAITNVKILDRTISGSKLSQMNAINKQVLKWNGSQWAPGDDDSGPGGTTPWTLNGTTYYNSENRRFLISNTASTTYNHNSSQEYPNLQLRYSLSLVNFGFENLSPTDRGLPFIKIMESSNVRAGMIFNKDTRKYDVFANGEKKFVMAHPHYKDSLITYSCLEGPEAAAYERGTARLENGRAKVNFSGHFGLVINPSTMTINLTPLSLESKGLAIISRDANGFVVGELNQGFGNYEFDWEVKAVRKGFENNKVIRHISEYQINTEPSKE